MSTDKKRKLTAEDIEAELYAQEEWAPKWDKAVKRNKEIEAMEESEEKKKAVEELINDLKAINKGACKFRKRNMTIATKLHVAEKIGKGSFEMYKELRINNDDEMRAKYALFSILKRLSDIIE